VNGKVYGTCESYGFISHLIVFINIVKAITIPFFSKVKSISGDLKIYISVSREKFKTKIRISGKCGNVIVETELRKNFSSVA